MTDPEDVARKVVIGMISNARTTAQDRHRIATIIRRDRHRERAAALRSAANQVHECDSIGHAERSLRRMANLEDAEADRIGARGQTEQCAKFRNFASARRRRAMGDHLVNGRFKSDKYPTTPAGKVPLSTADPMAQDLLWEYAQRRRSVDEEFSSDLETALRTDGFVDQQEGNTTMPTDARKTLVDMLVKYGEISEEAEEVVDAVLFEAYQKAEAAIDAEWQKWNDPLLSDCGELGLQLVRGAALLAEGAKKRIVKLREGR